MPDCMIVQHNVVGANIPTGVVAADLMPGEFSVELFLANQRIGGNYPNMQHQGKASGGTGLVKAITSEAAGFLEW